MAKAADFSDFSNEISKSPFLYHFARILAWIVPIVEAAVGFLLLIKKTRRFALYTYLYIMASFTFYVFLMEREAYYLPCACMGLFENLLNWKQHLYVNIFLTLLVIASIFLEGSYMNRIKILEGYE
ncbi:MauE/DoxX family redox-associated membrane protein [Olivibacter jilunii]|uniref:MauE/DoxX family redox-associated membrane protein n=1 Tax=Olivibacter jilunii TaxID=985016 RepID=UPI003BF8363F